MPKAILALRSYPLAILMALVLFVCSFLIAASSIGTIGGGGGDDQGSGMGGTGRTGGYNGDSGFGGTGGPSPFLGSSDTVEGDAAENNGNIESENDTNSSDSLIEPFLQQQETARIPDEMRPLIELQRSSPQSPDFGNGAPALDILDDEREEVPLHVRRVLEMAESDTTIIVEPTLEIQVQIPEATGTDSIERYRLEVAEQTEAAMTEPDANARSSGDSENTADAPFVMQQLNTEEIAGNDADKAVDAELLQLDAADSSRPLIPERIQRPELPPFQRMRPAVDRASITPPRPRPMAI